MDVKTINFIKREIQKLKSLDKDSYQYIKQLGNIGMYILDKDVQITESGFVYYDEESDSEDLDEVWYNEDDVEKLVEEFLVKF